MPVGPLDCNGETLCRKIESGMMIRRIFAGSIVALLLSLSPLAAACDLSCAFPSVNSDCHSEQTKPQGPSSGDMKMDGMATDGMTMPEMANSEGQQGLSAISLANAAHPSIGEMGPCERQACDTGSAVSAKTSRSADLHFHSMLAVADTSRVSNALSLFHGARDNIATDHVRDGSPLHLSLRV
jgi:hypothetical protein